GRATAGCRLRAQVRGPAGPFRTRDRCSDHGVGERRGGRSGARLPAGRWPQGQSRRPRALRAAGLRTSQRPHSRRASDEPVRATRSAMRDAYTVTATDGAARAGVLRTAHGDVPTPAFMPVGTKATVKTVDPDELRALGATIVLGNTYHLHFRPGEDLIAELGGLHHFMGWDGPILTDSGGYQVFSLAKLRKLSEQGVTFRSPIDGATHELTPERVVEIQRALGVDIMHPLDECLAYPATREQTAAVAAALPAEQPRYLMGVGKPDDLVEAVASGVDMFDCVLPTRNARNGQAFTPDGPVTLKQARWARDPAPLQVDCPCYACRRFSRAYLRHLFMAEERL